jgi:predicted RNA-binding Zn ribbon-like protein
MYDRAMDRSDSRLFFKFLNSHDFSDEIDDWFTSPDLFERWLTEQSVAESGLIEVTPEDVELARDARDALNALIDRRDAPNVARLNAIARRLPVHARFEESGSRLEPSVTGIAGLTARVIGLAHDAMTDGTWDRLSRCHNDSCRWAFIDESKNHSRRWCDMNTCGTQAKSRAYRARQRARRAPGAPN